MRSEGQFGFQRSQANPVLMPRSDAHWESYAVFNGSVIESQGQIHMFYRALSSEMTLESRRLRISSIGLATQASGSVIGREWIQRRLFLWPEEPWERFGAEDPRATWFEGKCYITYTAIGAYPFRAERIRLAMAMTEDLNQVSHRGLVTPFNAKAMCLFPERVGGKVTAIFSRDTDQPPARTSLVQASSIEDFWDSGFWKEWERKPEYLDFRRMNSDHIEMGATPIATDDGWLVLYAHIENYGTPHVLFGVEALLLDRDDPRKLIGRTWAPLLQPQSDYEQHGTVPNVLFPSGVRLVGSEIQLIYGAADTTCAVASMGLEDLLCKVKKIRSRVVKAHRFEGNPILAPRPGVDWESLCILNPGAIEIDRRIHILYRAQDESGTSRIGHATTLDGLHIEERFAEPIYVPRKDFEHHRMGHGFCGCEDPRITRIGNTLHLFYTAYDGVNPPRVAHSTIELENFRARRWDRWTEPLLISPPGMSDKDACVFPEKIGGSYWTLHRWDPDMIFDVRDELDFSGERWLKDDGGRIRPRHGHWDDVKIGANTDPILIDEGWLLLYHGVCSIDRHYRLGALLLDRHDPRKVLGRSLAPILEPDSDYENEGITHRVVFPCGWVRRGDLFYIYYGAADSVIGVATMSKEEILATF